MKKSISFTFDLIKKLNSKEKKYIKQRIRIKGKHLLQLFEDLDKCTFYQKNTFINQNKNKAYIKNLLQNQTSLRNKVIDLLISYHSKSIFEIDLHHQINKALILIEKKFYKQAKKIIDQCLNKALDVDDHATCYNLVNIILKAINNKVYFELSVGEINDFRKKKYFYLTQLERRATFSKLNEIYSNISNSKDQLNAYKEKFKELNILNKRVLPVDYPFGAKQVFYFSKAHFAILSGCTKDYLFFTKEVFNLYLSNEHLIKHHFTSFLGDAVNFLDSLIETHDFSTFFTQHQIVTDLIKANEKEVFRQDNSLINIIQYYFLQAAYNNAGYFEKSVQFADKYLNFLNRNSSELSTHFIAKSSIEISLAFLYSNLYEKAITHLELAFISNDYSTQYISRILKLIIHYALKNELLLESLFKSFFHYLNTVNKKEQITNIRKLKKHVKNKTVHKLTNDDFEDFVYIHWDLFENV